MQATIYQTLFPYSEVGGDMLGRIKSHSLYEIFQPLDDLNLSADVYNKVVFYILDCYSIESESLVLNLDWQDVKERVFSKWELPEEMRKGLVLLANNSVKDTIRNYCDAQKGDNLRHYFMLQDLYVQQLNGAVSMSKELTYKEKHNVALNANETKKEVERFRQIIAEEYSVLKHAEKELPGVKKKKFISINIEDHLNTETDADEKEDD
jgi:hypothetical protein